MDVPCEKVGISNDSAGRPAGDGSLEKPSLLGRCTHIVVLCALTITQPVLDLLGSQSEFFVVRRFDRAEIIGLVVVLMVVVPLPAIALEAVLWRCHKVVRQAGHLLVVAVLTCALAALALKSSGELPGGLVLILAIAAGAAGTALYARFSAARSFVSLMAISLIVIPAAFFFNPAIAELMETRHTMQGVKRSVACDAPIVWVIFDEFSLPVLLDENHEINRNRYPNFAAFADHATWYRDAMTIAENTMDAVPSIVSGKLPKDNDRPWLKDHPDNLFTLFGGDYDVWAREPITQLCPEALNRFGAASEPPLSRFRSIASDLTIVYLHILLPQEYTQMLPEISYTWSDFGVGNARPVTTGAAAGQRPPAFFEIAKQATRLDRQAEVEQLIDAIRPSRKRQLYFLHVLLPHRPWEYLPDGHRYYVPGSAVPGLRGKKWGDDPYLTRQAYVRYILQTIYLDGVIGRVLAKMKAVGIFDEALIVLLADHGVSFTPGGYRRWATRENAHEILPVPLFIKAPQQETGEIVDGAVSTVDVLPTVLDLLGVEAGWPMDGISALEGRSGRHRRMVFVTTKRGSHDVDLSVVQGIGPFLRTKVSLFGDGRESWDLFRFGPHGDLVGRPVDELQQAAPLKWKVRVADLDQFQHVDLSDGYLPVLLNGAVRPPAGFGPVDLAVAVNGVVCGTMPTRSRADSWRDFTLVLPATVFRNGQNTVEVFRVVKRGARLVVNPLWVVAAR